MRIIVTNLWFGGDVGLAVERLQVQLLAISLSGNNFGGVATNVENLEYSGISLNMENSGNSQGILCNFRENCNKQSIFSSSFKYVCKTAVDWVNSNGRMSIAGYLPKNRRTGSSGSRGVATLPNKCQLKY